MKVLPLKNLFFNNTMLKIICLLCGYSFWYIASFDTVITTHITIPLSFISTTNNYTINAPETITITLKGKRSDLYTLDTQTLAAHINIDNYPSGKHDIIITEYHLFLPNTITLVRYTPSNLCININSQQTL